MSRLDVTKYQPPQGQRGNRLQAVELDPLESIGLPSKGDNRLLDFQTQEYYYGEILQRYEKLQTGAGSGDCLSDAFASLSLNGTTVNDSQRTRNNSARAAAHKKLSHQPDNDPREVSVVLMAMRKFREAIVASARKDAFALRSYVFIIRATILAKHMESYHPALLHLLHAIHPITRLTSTEYEEFVGYHILDLACRQNNPAAAYRVKFHYGYRNTQVKSLLKALVHGDWCAFWKIENSMTKHQQSLMESKEEDMRTRALDCLGKSYLTVDKGYLEKAVRRQWEELVEKNGTGWRLEGNVVTIRRAKGR